MFRNVYLICCIMYTVVRGNSSHFYLTSLLTPQYTPFIKQQHNKDNYGTSMKWIKSKIAK